MHVHTAGQGWLLLRPKPAQLSKHLLPAAACVAGVVVGASYQQSVHEALLPGAVIGVMLTAWMAYE